MQIALSGHYGYRRLLRTMLPMVCMMMVTSIYSIIDGFFVSNFAGSTAFAGMNIVWPGLSLLSALGIMIGCGGSALVSKKLGEGDEGKAREIFTLLIVLCLVIGLVFSIFSFIFMERICRALGADDQLLEHACLYGRIISCTMPFFIVQLAFEAFYMVAEKPQLGTLVSVACGLVNLGLDYLFVVVFPWGLAGAAVATAMSLVFGGIFPLVYFIRRRSKIYFVKFSLDTRAIVKSCTNGMSEFISNIALNLVSIFYNIQLMKYIGPDGVSAYGVIMYVGFIFGSIFIGYNIGVAQLISYNYGAKNHKEMTNLLHKSLVLVALGGFVLTVLAEISAPLLARIFFSYDTSLCELSTGAMRIYMLSFLLCGFSMFTSSWFTALNNGVVSAVAAFMRTLVFELGSIFILPLIFGTVGIWMSVCGAEIFSFCFCTFLLLHFRKRYGIGEFWKIEKHVAL